jgi:hypothetical protein
MQELEAARSAIPTVSLVSRLKYEKRPRADESPRELVTSAPVGSRLDDFEHTLELGAERKRQLLRLHTYQYRLFEGAVGFGLVRMIPLTPQSLHRPPLRDIGFAEVHVDWGDYFGAWRMAGRHTDQNAALPEYLHVLGRDDFLDPDGFGVAIEAPLKVTGFVEHAFHYPAFADLDARTSWTIKRLELVSLLKFDTPRVYVLDHLPRMDQLSSDDAPTRPLDAFETEALAKLWRDEDVVVKNDGDDYRMLGSLRAAKQCLECHSVQRGELLGAFTYSLRHEGPNKR